MANTQKNTTNERHVYCFVPGEGIDVVVLAAYLRRYIDGTATIKAARHPRVGHAASLASEMAVDLISRIQKSSDSLSAQPKRFHV
jgi:hypothetical protein